jgi:hypothetical protein
MKPAQNIDGVRHGGGREYAAWPKNRFAKSRHLTIFVDYL